MRYFLLGSLLFGCAADVAHDEEGDDASSGSDSSDDGEDAAPERSWPVNREGELCPFVGASRVCGSRPEQIQLCGEPGAGELEWSACLHEAPACIPGEHSECPLGGSTSCLLFDGMPAIQACPFTPLAIDLAGTGIELRPARAASFDIAGNGACLDVDWPGADTAWLVLDRDGDGAIADGSELFGSGTAMPDGRPPHNGFAALAILDEDRDGSITAADPRFAQIALWFDHDDDRRGTASELVPLDAMGIRRLPLAHRVDRECDDRGNCIVERATIETTRGPRELVDLHLACP